MNYKKEGAWHVYVLIRNACALQKKKKEKQKKKKEKDSRYAYEKSSCKGSALNYL